MSRFFAYFATVLILPSAGLDVWAGAGWPAAGLAMSAVAVGFYALATIREAR